jgi:hypothetical protein
MKQGWACGRSAYICDAFSGFCCVSILGLLLNLSGQVLSKWKESPKERTQKRSQHSSMLQKPKNFNFRRTWFSHSGGYGQYCLLWCNAIYSVESRPTFRRNILSLVLPKFWLTFNGLYGVTLSQKIVFFFPQGHVLLFSLSKSSNLFLFRACFKLWIQAVKEFKA